MIWEIIFFALFFALAVALVWYFLKLLMKYDDTVSRYFEKIIFKKEKKKFQKIKYPKISYNLIVEELGMLYSVHPTKEEAERVLKSMPFLIMKSFMVHAEEIDPQTNNILRWSKETGFSLWLKPILKQENA